MSKLDAEQLGRKAFVYIRQSTADQIQHNRESRRRQYGLVERAHTLGFADVEVVDEDLGRSGSGVVRPGFERLLAAICGGEAGAVLAVEASRLARNGRDWHTLLEFCALVGTAIVDEEGAYDPRLPNDRLLLGMKGTLSEMELSILRQRAHEALLLKARRGELYTSVAVGYVRTAGESPGERPGPARARGDRAGLRQVRAAAERTPSAFMAAPRGYRAAGGALRSRGSYSRVAVAGLPGRA